MKNELAMAMELMKLPSSDHLVDRLFLYMNLMAEWNELAGLTSIPPADWIRRHIMDSLSLLSFIPPATQLADIGSGAGLPAIPLALAADNSQWALIEKNGKKASFLLRVKNELALSNVRIIHKRAEYTEERNAFQVVTARAVGSCALLCRLAWPLLQDNGRLLAMKGKICQAELNALTEPWQAMTINRVIIPTLRGDEKPMNLSILIWQKN